MVRRVPVIVAALVSTLFISLLISVLVAVRTPSRASAAVDVGREAWRHPVDAEIVDYFRPPSGPYGAGNRGLEYDTRSGQVVVAVASGEVAFAGSVGRHRFVVVAHGPELRSTYAYLERIDVSVGDGVTGGRVIATSAPGFHLTARLHGTYVDPLGFMRLSWSVRLIARPSGPH